MFRTLLGSLLGANVFTYQFVSRVNQQNPYSQHCNVNIVHIIALLYMSSYTYPYTTEGRQINWKEHWYVLQSNPIFSMNQWLCLKCHVANLILEHTSINQNNLNQRAEKNGAQYNLLPTLLIVNALSKT